MKRMALATTHGSKRKVSKSASIMILRLSDSLCILCTPQVHGIVLGDDDNEKDGSGKGDDGGNEKDGSGKGDEGGNEKDGSGNANDDGKGKGDGKVKDGLGNDDGMVTTAWEWR
jgi:hypothetical protein